MSDENNPRAHKFFTGARRIPLMVGRFATGEKIPFGPYRITQFVVAGVVLVLCKLTNPLWTSGNILADVATGAAIVVVAGVISGRIPLTKRSAFAMGRSLLQALSAPAEGAVRRAPITIRKPHRSSVLKARHRYEVESTPISATPSAAESVAPVVTATPSTDARPQAVALRPSSVNTANKNQTPSAPRATSAVEALLAQAGATH